MKYHTLGRSPLEKVSEVAFGCMSLGMDDAANAKLIHRALHLGINFFDTADLYDNGINESTLGKALKGKREEAVIATKVGNQWREDGSGWDALEPAQGITSSLPWKKACNACRRTG